MAWQTLSLHFKQTLEGGYRYLDRCGEFMLEATEKLNCIPGEIKPTGARLEIPEMGLTAGVDASELIVGQEIPGEQYNPFLKFCLDLVGLANKHFAPKHIARNGFAVKSFWGFSTAQAALQASLKIGDEYHLDLGKLLGMVPAHKHLDYNLASGSLDLHVLMQPVTFEKVAILRRTASFKASRDEKARVDRQNIFADRTKGVPGHAVMMEIDLVEFDPPQESLERHFQEMQRLTNVLKREFVLS